MKIGLLQIDLTVGDFSGNSLKIQQAYDRVVKGGAELVVAPELGLCGYPPRDLLNREDFVQAHEGALKQLAGKIGKVPLLVGGIERFKGKDGRPLHNAAFLLQQKKARVVARKALLPTPAAMAAPARSSRVHPSQRPDTRTPPITNSPTPA